MIYRYVRVTRCPKGVDSVIVPSCHHHKVPMIWMQTGTSMLLNFSTYASACAASMLETSDPRWRTTSVMRHAMDFSRWHNAVTQNRSTKGCSKIKVLIHDKFRKEWCQLWSKMGHDQVCGGVSFHCWLARRTRC